MEAVIGTHFTMGKKIGNGAFGQIFEGTWKDAPNRKAIKVAIKIVSFPIEVNIESRKLREKTKREAIWRASTEFSSIYKVKVRDQSKQLTSINSPIDGIPQVFFFGKESNRFLMIMELMENGDLKGVLRDERPRFVCRNQG